MAAPGSGNVWRDYASFEGNNKAAVKVSPGAIASLLVENRAAEKQYFQLFDEIVAPAGADVPRFSFPVPVGGVLILDLAYWGEGGVTFSRGIAFGSSTTVGSYTAGSTDVSVHIRYY